MRQAVGPSARAATALAGAYGAAARTGGRVGTEHILVALTGRYSGPVAQVLDEFQVTPVVAMAVLRNAAGVWHSDDAVGVEDAHLLDDLEWYRQQRGRRKPMNYTGAAQAALRRATTRACR